MLESKVTGHETVVWESSYTIEDVIDQVSPWIEVEEGAHGFMVWYNNDIVYHAMHYPDKVDVLLDARLDDLTLPEDDMCTVFTPITDVNQDVVG
jgi:hypothetical protein